MIFKNTGLVLGRMAAIAALLLAGAPGCDQGGALDVRRYELTGAFDWDTQRLDATVRITFTGGGPRVELDSAVDVKDVRGSDGEALPFQVDAANHRLSFDLPDRSGETTIAISYEAAESENLRAIPPRAGDPVPIRALFTDSEPRGASRWMPCNDRPDDRAEIAFTMRMAADEAMIANGALVRDEGGAAERTMGYDMTAPIPTYLMAFAISRFEVETSDDGPFPVRVWHRAGVRGSYGPLLAELRREIDLFEGLLGPYPWDAYTLVLLPDILGMENAGITFQNEARSAEPEILGDRTLTAHELAHQWCGDMVTVSTWDDLWIKEGMATLLAAEAMRPFEDRSGRGTRFGDWLYPETGVPVRDPLRAPEDKYTSGAYSRGAWVFTQIRASVGEEVFWSTWRELLMAHRLGSIGTEDVIDAFAPHLGSDRTERARRAVDLRALPEVDYDGTGEDEGKLSVIDHDGILIAPFEVEWRRADGTIERLSPAEDGSISLERKSPGDLLVLDPGDVHPLFHVFPRVDEGLLGDDAVYGPELSELVGGSAESIPRYADIGGAHQLQALNMWYGEPLVSLEAYPGFVASLDAESARALALQHACSFAEYTEMPAAWGSMVAAALAADPHTLGLGWGWCASVPEVEALFAPEWDAVASGSVPAGMSLGRLQYIAGMTWPPGSPHEMWSTMVHGSDALRARRVAASWIRWFARETAGDPDTQGPWRELVLELLESNETSEVLHEAIRASRAYTYLDGASDMLPALVKILRSPVQRSVHWRAVCAARLLTSEDPAAWAALVADLDGAPLSHAAVYRLGFPSACD